MIDPKKQYRTRIRREVWVNVYPGHASMTYDSRDVADRYGGEQRVACVKLVIDCEEGEGLTDKETENG